MPAANVFTPIGTVATLSRFPQRSWDGRGTNMETPASEKSDGVSGCEACPGCEQGHSHEMPRNSIPGGLTGWPLAIAAFCVFVLPLGLAIAGAALTGKDPNWQLLGALAGFVVGVLLAMVVSRILRRRKYVENTKKESTDSTEGKMDCTDSFMELEKRNTL